MFDFPNAPSPGDNYQGYIWDGEKWTTPVAAAATSAYVLKGGDTMNGNLVISKGTPAFTMDCTDNGQTLIYMSRNRSLRWFIYGQSGAAADFGIGRCGDNGAYIDSPITMRGQTAGLRWAIRQRCRTTRPLSCTLTRP